MILKKIILVLSLFVSTSAYSTSLVNYDRLALEALIDQASDIDIKGDLNGMKLSEVLGSSLFTFNNQNVSLQIFNTCKVSKDAEEMDCRLSIMDTEDVDGETYESTIIIEYKAKINKNGKIEISKTARAFLAG